MSRTGLVNSIRSAILVFKDRISQKYPKSYQIYRIITVGSSRFGSETFQYLKLKLQLYNNKHKHNFLKFKDVEIIKNVIFIYFIKILIL